MPVISLSEEQRQVVLIALVELRRRRPGWDTFIKQLTDIVLEGKEFRRELDRLHDELGRAYSATWHERVEGLERTTNEILDALRRLDAYKEEAISGGNGELRSPRGGEGSPEQPEPQAHPSAV